MKYIILSGPGGRAIPVIFPDVLVHATVAGAMQMAVDCLDPRKNLRAAQCDRLLMRADVHKPVAAGFIGLGTDFTCGGESSSLGIGSRPHDAAVIALGEQAQFMPPEDMVRLWDALKVTRP